MVTLHSTELETEGRALLQSISLQVNRFVDQHRNQIKVNVLIQIGDGTPPSRMGSWKIGSTLLEHFHKFLPVHIAEQLRFFRERRFRRNVNRVPIQNKQIQTTIAIPVPEGGRRPLTCRGKMLLIGRLEKGSVTWVGVESA
jgi:hypothetical protein